MIKIILVDPMDLFRAGMKHLFNQYDNIELIADIAGGEDLIQISKNRQVDVFIISANVADTSIITLIKKLKRHASSAKILILANDTNLILARQYLIIGADGFLTKTISELQFIDAIKKLKSNKTVMPEALAQNLATRNYSESLSPFDGLSERELDILLLIVKGKSVKEISEILHLSPKTISTYKGRIFEKLNVTSMMDVFLLAIKFGLIKSESFA